MKIKKAIVRIFFCVLALALCVVLADVVKMGYNYFSNHKATTASAEPSFETISTSAPAPQTVEEAFDITYEAFDGYETVSLEEMNASFEKYSSRFSYEIRERLTRIYNGLVSNIGLYKYYMSFCGYPDTIIFINEKFVKPLGTISFIKTIYAKDPDFYDYRGKYGSSCFVPEENGVYLLWEYFIEDAEMDLILAEEIVHAGQRDLDKIEGYGDYLILGEGEANIIAAMQNPNINMENLVFFFDHYDSNHICELHGISHQQNILSTRYYTYLTVLIGYSNVMKFRETGDCGIIENAITEKFDIDGTELYDKMYRSLMSCFHGDIFDDASETFQAENMFLSCFNQIIQHVKTKEDAKAVFELYRYLCIQYKTQYMDYTEDEENGEDITDQFIDRTEVEDNLYQLVSRYGIPFISNPERTNREVFQAYIHPEIPDSPGAIPVLLNRKDLIYDKGANTLIIRNTENEDILVPVSEPIRNSNVRAAKDAGYVRY